MAKLKLAVVFAQAFVLVMFNSAFAGNAAEAYLSPAEREVLNELNLARTDPKQYAEFLSEMRQYFNGNHHERPWRIRWS